MKKKVLFIIIILMTVIGNTYPQQPVGHWILVDEATVSPYNDNVKNYTFYDANIDNNNIDITDLAINTFLIFDNDKIRVSDGIYDENNNLIFYLINNKVFDASNNEVGELGYLNSYANEMGPELRIMKKPGEDNVYQVFYTYNYVNSGESDQGRFAYVDITDNGNSISIGEAALIKSSPDWNIGFALDYTDINGWSVYYTSSAQGVMRSPILANGTVDINNEELVIDYNNPIIGSEYKFAAYNFELKRDNNGNVVFAWITYKTQGIGELYVVRLQGTSTSNPTVKKYSVSNNRLYGIEFSTLENEDDVIYFSDYGQGLKKLTGYTSTNPTIVNVANSGDFTNSYVQEGPDKCIYAVNSDGSKLGRIEYETGVFDNNVEDMDYTTYVNDDNSVKRFFLPERTGFYNMLDFTVETGVIGCECPAGDSTWAQVINVEGGEYPYYYTWYDANGNILLQGWGEDQIDNLPQGTYTVCVHDNSNPPLQECQTFQILLDPNLYTHDNWKYITANSQNWSSESYKFKKGIRVQAGADFTISGSYLQFGPDAKIIIEQGAKLTIDNSTCTYMQQCPCRWQGIEVWGTRNQPQTDEYQGKLTIINNSVIEGAVTAIELWKPGDYSATGGIVTGENSSFINNVKAVHANYYDYYVTINGKKYYKNNVGYFKNCLFDVNSAYLYNSDNNYQFYKHIDLSKVRGFKFYACDFSVDPDLAAVNPWNQGIAAYNAGFYVRGFCLSSVVPCTNFKTSTFTGFHYAIYAVNALEGKTFTVDTVHFINNAYGVYASSFPNETIIRSVFEIGENKADEGECEGEGETVSGYGIYMDGCHGFAIEQNSFTKYSGAPQSTYTGILCKDSETEYDIIYKNTFNGLSYGNFAEGMNRDDVSYDDHGLEYQCNHNSNNNTDFQVIESDDFDGMIRGYMGYTNISAGNTFSQQSGVDWHFLNLGDQMINYYWYVGNAVEEPLYYCILPPDPNPYPDPCMFFPQTPLETENTCPSHYGGGGGSGNDDRSVLLTPQQFEETEQDYLNALNDYNNVKALYDNLQDGGSTQALKSEIESAFPSDMWQLRSELLGVSPHVSKEVLMTTADKTDVFPESVLFEILSANPDELKNGDMISFLENKEQPLPEYMINLLKQIAGGVTYKTILKRQLADFHAKKSKAAQDIIRSILSDSVMNMQLYRNWLDNLGGLGADKQIVASYIQEGDFASAQTLLDLIPSLYGLSGERLEQYNDYKSLTEFQMGIAQQNRDIIELDSLEIDFLVDLAENHNGTAKVVARGILSFGYGYNYCDCLPSDSSSLKSSAIDFDKPTIETGFGISAKPNPADSWVAFNYKLPAFVDNAIITVTDVDCRKIITFSVSDRQGQQLWDTRNIKSGIYIITIETGNFKISEKLIIR